MSLENSLRLADWCHTPQGQLLFQDEKAVIDDWLKTCLGYFMLHIGYWPVEGRYFSTHIRQQFLMTDQKPEPNSTVLPVIRGHIYDLPFMSDSLDMVYCPHVLEYLAHPHRLLREIERVLVPEGHCIITVFNPVSLWYLSRLLKLTSIELPASYFLRVGRICDWLKLLGFDIVASKPILMRSDWLPEKSMKLMQKMTENVYPYSGAVVCLLVKKKKMTLTPVKYKWQLRNRILSAGLVEGNASASFSRKNNE